VEDADPVLDDGRRRAVVVEGEGPDQLARGRLEAVELLAVEAAADVDLAVVHGGGVDRGLARQLDDVAGLGLGERLGVELAGLDVAAPELRRRAGVAVGVPPRDGLRDVLVGLGRLFLGRRRPVRGEQPDHQESGEGERTDPADGVHRSILRRRVPYYY